MKKAFNLNIYMLEYLYYSGAIHYDNSRFPEALQFFQKIISKCEEHQLQNEFYYAEALGLTGRIHHLIKNLNDAENYLLKSGWNIVLISKLWFKMKNNIRFVML